jgi:hypothetical protein
MDGEAGLREQPMSRRAVAIIWIAVFAVAALLGLGYAATIWWIAS